MEVQPIFSGLNGGRPLAPRSYRVYRAIIRHKRLNDGCAPSIRDLMDATGISSTSVVHWHLDRLERAGLIQRGAGSRSIRVVGGSWSAGKAAAN